MPYRTFSDATGKEWQVWDIVPRLNERRLGAADRRVETVVVPFVDRRAGNRRTSSAPRTILRGSFAYGWLCFDSGAEKRRLTPIPTDWTTCEDERIEEYMIRATPVVGTQGMTFHGKGDDTISRAADG